MIPSVSPTQMPKQTRRGNKRQARARARARARGKGEHESKTKMTKHTGFFPNDAPFDVEPQRDIASFFSSLDSSFVQVYCFVSSCLSGHWCCRSRASACRRRRDVTSKRSLKASASQSKKKIVQKFKIPTPTPNRLSSLFLSPRFRPVVSAGVRREEQEEEENKSTGKEMRTGCQPRSEKRRVGADACVRA